MISPFALCAFYVLIADQDKTFLSALVIHAYTQEKLGEMFTVQQAPFEHGRRRINSGDGSALVIIPKGFSQAVFGNRKATIRLITNPSQFILLVMFTTGGITLYQERMQGILRRLASSPTPRSAVVFGKALSRLTIGLLQITFAMISGAVLFKVDWGPHVVMVLMVLSAYATLAALAGMLLGNFGKSEGQILAIGVILSIILSAIGGCWWPIEITPAWAQKASLVPPPAGPWEQCTSW
jgi:ABC-type multidrug transport system permease subunit